jgi:hypothetical protein
MCSLVAHFLPTELLFHDQGIADLQWHYFSLSVEAGSWSEYANLWAGVFENLSSYLDGEIKSTNMMRFIYRVNKIVYNSLIV